MGPGCAVLHGQQHLATGAAAVDLIALRDAGDAVVLRQCTVTSKRLGEELNVAVSQASRIRREADAGPIPGRPTVARRGGYLRQLPASIGRVTPVR
ncbi:hypothetical protein TUM20985_16290 [Mycobacterium antarcticum]|nr:hypothetical protein TUM20985_16290 [Mycolicibacterium sp. TUM20985]GLP74432.1 hypothetical protein TUM20983_15420 [Mycolicibacterium sp. TUM20983]GLP80229.1 hypothetical protein TUM20984_16490 [Mycolicibacterium sp. TUM20984]